MPPDLFAILIVVCICSLMISLTERERKKPVELTNYHEESCEWNNGEKCPYVVVQQGTHNGGLRRYVADGGMSCCKIRQQKVKFAKAIVDGKLPTKGQQIITGSQAALDDHKMNHPEEHKYLFGE